MICISTIYILMLEFWKNEVVVSILLYNGCLECINIFNITFARLLGTVKNKISFVMSYVYIRVM